MTKIYNQLENKETYYSCSLYGFYNIILYDYGIKLNVEEMLNTTAYFIKIKTLLRWGAYAGLIYPSLVKYVEEKTGLKLKIVKGNITTLDNKKGRILGFKKANSTYIDLSKDGKITRSDIDKIIESNKGSGHFHFWKRNTIVESLGGYPYRMMGALLNYAYYNGLYYSSVRAFIPADRKTNKMQEYLIKEVKKRGEFISYDEFLYIKGDYDRTIRSSGSTDTGKLAQRK